MKVGDLVKAMIITGHPKGIIIKVEQTHRWGALHFVHLFDDLPAQSYHKAVLREHQLEVINASR